ncbi:maternal effect embryo arrest protein [Perilla frutescens var. frutescens]|nr:maternal effect embryo arrest protein [Perilla frutescens var. frutescens]
MESQNNTVIAELPAADSTTIDDLPPPDASATAAAARLSSVHVTALDGFVSVNSLFTMAIFIGFSLTRPDAASAESRAECTASGDTVRRLIVFEVVSFSFFLFSSLIAQSLKLSINLINNMDPTDPHKADIDPDFLKYGLFGSAVGSVMGCLFLLLSIVEFIQVKLGVYSCGGKPVHAMAALVVFVGSGLLVYLTTAIYAAFFIEVSSKNSEKLNLS